MKEDRGGLRIMGQPGRGVRVVSILWGISGMGWVLIMGVGSEYRMNVIFAAFDSIR